MFDKVKFVGKVILALFLVITLPYYNAVLYEQHPHQPFSGNRFYNPYNGLNGKWIKANFHAHSRLLLGLTNGDNTMEEIFNKYDTLGYDLPCLSNYNAMTTGHERSFYTNVYEHGVNVSFTHQLVFNSKTASAFDYPLVQLTGHKQYILNRLNSPGTLVALAHPSFKGGYDLEELEVLKNYELMEIVSPRASSFRHWDKALSSGKVVWGIGNDDAHNLKEGNYGVAWTMINVGQKNNAAVINSLKKGKCYATRGWMGQEMNRLKALAVNNGVYHLEMEQQADSITLVSDRGKVVATAANTKSIDYEIQPENTYVRAEIFETESWNKYTKMYLNPVIRTKHGKLNMAEKEIEVSWMKTILYFLVLSGMHLIILRLIFKW